MTPVDKFTFTRVFEGNKDGVAILDYLTLKFWRNPYREDDRDALAMAYRAGQMSVIDYINQQINEANNGNDSRT